MSETVRTSIFVACAAVSLLAAKFLGPSVPKAPQEYSLVGKEFFPDFKDPDAAKSLQVISYNNETASIRVFGVEQGPDGIWRIPSRNNYPVDGKDRLAKSATSVIGLKREGLAGQRKSQHAEFGVLDPGADSVSDYKGVGNRLILKDGKDGKVLVDLIIGKEVKGSNGYFYVRKNGEDQTYRAKVSLDVSTKFADWIEPDLLKLDGSKLRTVVIDKSSVEFTPRGGVKFIGKETNTLTRASASDKWKLEPLDESKEEVNEEEVRKLVQALDDLKIVGVRQKNEKLKKSLQGDAGLKLDDRTMLELQDVGIYFVQNPDRKGMEMISHEGDVTAITDQGVAYDLRFGTVFSGSEEEVEAGFIKSEEEKAAAEKAGDEAKDGEKKSEEAADDKKPGAKKIKSRYLFARAQFAPEALGPAPEEPVKPEEPAEEAKTEVANPDTPADAAATENGAEKPDPKKAHAAAMLAYEGAMQKYEADKAAYEEKIKTGEKLVKDLNRRFAEWYYVISGDSFENLRQGRKTLVKEKTAAAENAAPGQGGAEKAGGNDQ